MEMAFESVLEEVKEGHEKGPGPAKTLRQGSVESSEAEVLGTERISEVSQSNSLNKVLPDSGAAGGMSRRKLPCPQLGPLP